MPSQWAFLCLISHQLMAGDLIAAARATDMVAVVPGTGVRVMAAGATLEYMGLAMEIMDSRPGSG